MTLFDNKTFQFSYPFREIPITSPSVAPTLFLASDISFVSLHSTPLYSSSRWFAILLCLHSFSVTWALITPERHSWQVGFESAVQGLVFLTSCNFVKALEAPKDSIRTLQTCMVFVTRLFDSAATVMWLRALFPCLSLPLLPSQSLSESIRWGLKVGNCANGWVAMGDRKLAYLIYCSRVATGCFI